MPTLLTTNLRFRNLPQVLIAANIHCIADDGGRTLEFFA